MKRIVFVSPYDHHGASSGARKRTEELCKAMTSVTGNDVLCLSPWSPPNGIRHKFHSMDGSLLKRLKGLFSMMWALHSIKPDLVISESPLCPFSFGRFIVFHMIHDSKFSSAYSRRGASLAKVMQWFSVRISNKVMTVSDSERIRISTHLRIPIEKIVVSYNGISDEWILRPLPPANEKRKFDVLYVSNFASHKGHLNFLRTVKNQKYNLAFVGADFGELGACKHFAESHGLNATFFSNLSESELIAIYDNSCIFVFPSKFEGFGIPYIEARARGLPVLASCIPVFAELEPLIGGYLVDFNDPKKVINSISALLLSQPQNYLPPPTLREFQWKLISEKILDIQT
jgi:glycosyltransferase involved in cell wall biosynthesis